MPLKKTSTFSFKEKFPKTLDEKIPQNSSRTKIPNVNKCAKKKKEDSLFAVSGDAQWRAPEPGRVKIQEQRRARVLHVHIFAHSLGACVRVDRRVNFRRWWFRPGIAENPRRGRIPRATRTTTRRGARNWRGPSRRGPMCRERGESACCPIAKRNISGNSLVIDPSRTTRSRMIHARGIGSGLGK